MIKFKYDEKKFWLLTELFSQRVEDFDVLKACKLMYFVDREHLLKTGRTITGDTYVGMGLGPVPSRSYDYLKDIQNGKPISESVYVSEKLTQKGYPVFCSKSVSSMECLSRSELDTIEKVIADYSDKSADELVDISHKHTAWLKSERNAMIDFQLFFADEPDKHLDALEAMILEQDDRDFVDDI